MATGIEMLRAVKAELQRHPEISELALNDFDTLDLFKLTTSELQDEYGVDPVTAEAIVAETSQGKLDKLGAWLRIKFSKDDRNKNLIPGEGIRRAAGSLAVEGEEFDLEALVREIRQMRCPELH